MAEFKWQDALLKNLFATALEKNFCNPIYLGQTSVRMAP
jgi:hypothetical protein